VRVVVAVTPLLIGGLVARHHPEQPQKVFGSLELVLSERGAHEEAGHHRLADVADADDMAQAPVGEADPDDALDHRLVLADQLRSRALVARAHL